MTTPRAIAPIATLPVFFKLAGRRVLVAGGTPPAVWKAELLAAAGAAVRVVAADPCAEMIALADALGEARLRLKQRTWTGEDLAGAALAIGAFTEEADGAAFRDAARAAGVPVNVIDVPPLCDFQFGTIVERSPLVIGISTDGAAPVLGQALRTRIEALMPPAMGTWAEAAQRWRVPLQALRLGFAARRRFWETFAEMALEGGDRLPREEDRALCLDAARGAERTRTGRIVLVGAGPGGADLLTLAAVKALQSADLIITEPGVAPAILGLGRREATRAAADAGAPGRAVQSARDGGTVAWIGPGDPESCPAWAARRSALQDADVPVGIVRGLRCAAWPAGCAAREPQ